jgi:hypothetical protein
MNGDSLSGTTGSVFTSSGSPVAWSATTDNLYRLRGGWLGAGLVVLEIMSPDGNWVTMHTYHFPNTLSASYTYTTTWNYQAEVMNSTNATNISMYMGGAAFGSTDPTYRMTDVVSGTSNALLTKSTLQGQYLSSPPTVSTSGNYNALQITSSANLKVDLTSTSLTALPVTGPVQTGNAPGVATVGVTSANILAANSSRTALILINTHATNTISLGLGANAAVLGSGITLYPGGSITFNVLDNMQQAVQAIASGASTSLAIQEII